MKTATRILKARVDGAERDDFEKWAAAIESWVSMTGGTIVCYDEDLKIPSLDATEFVLKLIAAQRINREIARVPA